MAPNPRDRVVGSIERLLEVDREVRKRIQENEAILRRALKEFVKGTPVAEAMDKSQAGFGRQRVNEALDALTEARHEFRLAITVAGLEEGMSIGELGRAWGISRQLASQYAKEARDRT
jgi:transposase-like protein